jgi:cytochrome c biogenesis protein CcmG/thiol:disulfide interchange protein DsbE
MDTYYTLLDIPVDAAPQTIEQAYQRQRERYNAARVAELDAEFRRIAAERSAALDHAYHVLADPERRRAYDRSIGASAAPAPMPRAQRRVSRREWLMLAGGALVGLIIIAVVWFASGRSDQGALQSVAEVNRPAPAFTLSTLDGKQISLSDYRGKVVMLNFWYTKCPPCREETPALQHVYQQLADKGLVILGVNVRQNEQPGAAGDQDIRNFAKQFGVTYPIVIDSDRSVATAYQIYPLPTSIFIDPNGQERYRSFSTVTAQDVERIFTELQRGTAADASKE